MQIYGCFVTALENARCAEISAYQSSSAGRSVSKREENVQTQRS